MERALFWDFDGTLSYPNKSFSTALYCALSEKGYNLDEEDCNRFLSNLYSWKSPQITYPDKIHGLWWETHFEKIRTYLAAHSIPDTDFDAICAAFRERLISVSNYALYDDTAATLEACRKLGFKNYLITNNYPEILENLKTLNIADFFTDYIVSSHIGYEKPRKEFFDYAKKISGVSTGYVIGDNPKADIQGGKDAGFITIAVHECKQSNADYYFETLAQILPILEK